MRQNIDIFDFELSQADMEAINPLDTAAPIIVDHYSPDFVDYILNTLA